jgi:NADPH:quinone reductase-like Zn-dependent oxidoreductase
MKAILYNKKVPDKLIYSDVEKPVPNDDEVLIKISAVSINAADYRSMKLGMIPKKKIFGADIAGEVEAVGKNILQFKPGDEVFGDILSYGFGGLAEYAVAPERLMALKPEKLSFVDAASIPIAGMTAMQALRDKGNIQEGKKVLIVGSAGGVGTFAVQLAKYFGAEVTAVCSTQNVEQTISLGADFVIDYKKEDFTKSKKRYDIILAVNGGTSLTAYKRLLNTNGIYIMIGGSYLQIFKSLVFGRLMSLGSKKMFFLVAKPNQKDLEFLAELMVDGKIKAVIEKCCPLEKAPEAMNYLALGHAKGKIVITIL